MKLSGLIALLMIFSPGLVMAGEAKVAVAANFTAPMKLIASKFERKTGHHLKVSFGSTGILYSQIINGAPFDVFLAADIRRPAALIKRGLTNDVFTYAVGKLVLWSPEPDLIEEDGRVLIDGNFRKLAVASPKTAPYGVAADQVLKSLGLREKLAPRLVRGTSIAQTFQFVYTGNADVGLVALSQISGENSGSRWDIPQSLYTPLKQNAVLLKRGEDNRAALDFLAYMRQPQAMSIIRSYGYGLN